MEVVWHWNRRQNWVCLYMPLTYKTLCDVTLSEMLLAWSKTQQKGLNLAKELGYAVPECTLISKLTNNDNFCT